MQPLVSVVLPVYNGAEYIESSLSSILSQVNCDFEVVIVNDGSVDSSGDRINEFKDSRIRYFEQTNKGLPATLNRAISLARSEYLARQDQDDISFPLRLQKQVAFLNANPDVGMVGTFAEIWARNDKTDRLLAHPTDDASIRFGLLFNNLFVHSSVMIRRSVLEEVGGYSEDKSRQPPEDYELWSRVMRQFKLANLPEILMTYREVPNSMSRTGVNPFLPNLVKISAENIAWASGWAVDSTEVISLSRLYHGAYEDIPRRIKFSRLSAVLNDAADGISIASGVSRHELEAPLQARIKLLRYKYFEYRSGGLIKKMTSGTIGSYAKRAAKKFFTVANS
jgi:glycosyltransferase involved in cell wall biosynthesis